MINIFVSVVLIVLFKAAFLRVFAPRQARRAVVRQHVGTPGFSVADAHKVKP